MPEIERAQVLLRAIRYEHWLRYYFAEPEEDAAEESLEARFELPAEWLAATRRDEPEFAPLLEALLGKSVSLQESRDAVYAYTASNSGLDPADPALGEMLFDLVSDPDFRRGLDAFHGWVQELANGLTPSSLAGNCGDDKPVSFANWEQSFQSWASENIKPHITTISPL